MTVSFPSVTANSTIEEAAEHFRLGAQHAAVQPFTAGDTTAGMEYELQVAVEGNSSDVDLPLTIRQSSYFRNIIKRSERGDCTHKLVSDLTSFLDDHNHTVWENSWVRIQTSCLSAYAVGVVEGDLAADKARPDGPLRSDKQRFFCVHKGEQWLRLPISYILKLALADCIGRERHLPTSLLATAIRLQDHFISDNTSPEILSFGIAEAEEATIGRGAARETARTYLLSQLLLQYANSQFDLVRHGQRSMLYFSPQAPQQQKILNDLVPDSFYRQLFMSPCLSGWDRGEEKHAYMELCHRTLSRSQLNTIAKLKDAGIITNNLIVLPNTSNTCLANNGTHVSLGSRILTSLAGDSTSGFSPAVEKYFGDLVIKITEHFLPLLVTTCTAAPYRIDYADFHPEKVLGFLPHELDYTHLRMLWRRWQKKADIRFFGNPVTPFGPYALDRLLAFLMRARGDLIPDFRLIDYLVALLSTETSPALNGRQDNQYHLMRDLTEMGVFDQRMSIYLPYRLREFGQKGYSGFEGRSYSLFPSLLNDVRDAVDIQNLVTALAYRYVIEGKISHADIPDTPQAESERRQIFFASAIGIPTVYCDENTGNRLLARILSYAGNKRSSRRYRGYTRVQVKEYQLGLLKMIEHDYPDLVEQLHGRTCLQAVKDHLLNNQSSAFARLTDQVLKSSGERCSPLSVPAARFNQASEEYYRNELRQVHLQEGLAVLCTDCRDELVIADREIAALCRSIRHEGAPVELVQRYKQGIIEESLSPPELRKIIMLSAAVIQARESRRTS